MPLGPDGRPEFHITSDDRPYVSCDFCSAPMPTSNDEPAGWVYPCASFDLPAWHTGSVGDWAACATCAGLVEANERTALTWRCLSRLEGARTDRELATAVSFLGALHGGFWRHKSGPRVPHRETLYP